MNIDYSRPRTGIYQIILGQEWHEIEWFFLEDYGGVFCSGYIYGSPKTIEALLFYRPWSMNLYDVVAYQARCFCSVDILYKTSPGWLGLALSKFWPKFGKSRLYITYSEWPELLAAVTKKLAVEESVWQRDGF